MVLSIPSSRLRLRIVGNREAQNPAPSSRPSSHTCSEPVARICRIDAATGDGDGPELAIVDTNFRLALALQGTAVPVAGPEFQLEPEPLLVEFPAD